MICKRCIVSGHVQGVWFRDTTRKRANELGVQGSAVNLEDGSVEVIACGEPDAVQALGEWLWTGSILSSVSDVTCEQVEISPPEGFIIG